MWCPANISPFDTDSAPPSVDHRFATLVGTGGRTVLVREGVMKDKARVVIRRALHLCVAVAALGVGIVSAQGIHNADGVAVIIGNENYVHRNADGTKIEAVRYAHRDADAFRQYVLDVLDFDPQNVIVELDADKKRMEDIFGNHVTHKGELWRRLAASSDVVVFYSGHGAPGLDDHSAYLLPIDADPGNAEIGGYPLDMLYENLGKLPDVRSVHVYVDSCFSGNTHAGMLIGDIKGPMNVEPKEPESHLTVLSATSAGTGRALGRFSAARPVHPSPPERAVWQGRRG